MPTRVIPALLVLFLLSLVLPAGAQAPAPSAAPAQPPVSVPANNVVRWTPGSATAVVGKDQMKVLTAGDIKIAVTMVDLWKETTAARVQITNLGTEALGTGPESFALEVVKPKPQSLQAIPGEKLSKDIRKHAESESQMAGQQAMHYASANGAGEKDEAARIRLEGAQKADYIKDSALTPNLQPRYQAIGHAYFPYLKKRDEIVLRMTIGTTTYEFPFDKSEVHQAIQAAQ